MIYPRPLQLVHWGIALLVVCQLAIAVVLDQLRSLDYGQFVLELHRQLGLVILLLVAARFVLRIWHSPPKAADAAIPTWQHSAASLVHAGFLLLLVAQPIIGIGLAWARGDTVGIFGIARVASPWELSEATRDRMMGLHAGVAIALFALCVLHVGAVVFNRLVRGISVIDRMLPEQAADRLVNRVPVATQFSIAFGIVVAFALSMGVNAVATYREFNRSMLEFQQNDVASADQTRAAQVAWKELIGLRRSTDAAADPAHLQELTDLTRSSLEEAAAHTVPGELRSQVDALVRSLAGVSAGTDAARLSEVDTKLQELVDAQSLAAFQRRTETEQAGARGHDLIVLTVLPMMLAGIIAALLLARSVTGSLGRMRLLIRSVESERQDGAIAVAGAGEFAALTRDIVSMRNVIEQRSRAAADERAKLESERSRLAVEQQAREANAEREGRVARQAQRERMAAAFEQQIAGIIDTVVETAQALSTIAGSMSRSASDTTNRSREASEMAERTNGTVSKIAGGAGELSTTARAVRENAQDSRERALRAVAEASSAREHIERLLGAARQIGSITEVIDAVTRQTNLLAVNARVEAARAGDAGRGFAIVANEVKALASQTGGATSRIGQQIEEVITGADRSAQSLQRLQEVIAGLEGAANAIFGATEEQFAATREIADRMREISTSTDSVARNVREAQNTAGATESLSSEVAEAAEFMDAQAARLSDQVAEFVLQLKTGSGQTQSGRAERADAQGLQLTA